MASINPYIHFNGNCEEAFNLYKAAFGGEFSKLVRYKEFPMNPDFPITEEEANKIFQIALPIGKNNVLMGNDTPKFMGRHNESETRSKIHVSAKSKEKAEYIFKALSEGGEIEMPFNETAPGSFFGMFRDKFGIEWMVEFNVD
ncbi:VOC family protein [Jiulongibacter sediminis]|uniref:Glyoxalase n=1 Tax=Jiulongibacter sediminis TaxID=1605367 RepID=A0A0P7C1C2_9BACT|nr:VOC family protein [Jiulongibacter sediminis]KPM47783.1 glyoxalase [Jiulongibacter sediminis]TBX23967.1 glyoxalase [Jiulongibacter sediminis]